MNTYKRNLLFRKFSPKQMKLKDKVRSSTSCHCSDCGNRSKFQKINTMKLVTNQARRRKVLWRFKAVINCVLFIMYYKTTAIIKFRKRVRLLQIIRQTQGSIPRSHKSLIMTGSSSPLFEQPRMSLSKKNISINDETPKYKKKYSFIKEETQLSEIRKPPPNTLKTYLTNKFISMECKQQIQLKSLNNLNKKYQRKIKNMSLATISSVKLSVTSSQTTTNVNSIRIHKIKQHIRTPTSEYSAEKFTKAFEFFKIRPRLQRL